MKFNYFVQTGCHYRYDSEGNAFDSEDEGYDFDYEVDDSEALGEIPAIMAGDREIFPKGIFPEGPNGECFIPWKQRYIIAQNIVNMMKDLDSADKLLERYYNDLKDIFHDEAMGSEKNR